MSIIRSNKEETEITIHPKNVFRDFLLNMLFRTIAMAITVFIYYYTFWGSLVLFIVLSILCHFHLRFFSELSSSIVFEEIPLFVFFGFASLGIAIALFGF